MQNINRYVLEEELQQATADMGVISASIYSRQDRN